MIRIVGIDLASKEARRSGRARSEAMEGDYDEVDGRRGLNWGLDQPTTGVVFECRQHAVLMDRRTSDDQRRRKIGESPGPADADDKCESIYFARARICGASGAPKHSS